MGSEWIQSSLGDTCYITDGAHSKVERQSEGVLYLTSKNIGEGNLKLDSYDFISEQDFERLFTDTKKSQRRLRDGDILTGIIGTFGNAYRYRKDDHFGISSSVAILRPNQALLNPDFLYYAITSQSFKATVEAYKGGSVQGYTNIATLKTLPIPLPDLSSQRHIVEVLSSLDNKIALNRQINATLESMAQALFKSWFVDFDPVIDNALAAGNDIPEPLIKRAEARAARRASAQVNSAAQANNAAPASQGDHEAFPDTTLPAEIQQLFPDAFVFTEEMGWVPEGWETVTLLDLCSKITDGAHQSPASVNPEAGLPMASSKDLTPQGISYDSCRYISRSDFDNLVSNGCMPEIGDVLIAKDGSKCGETCCIHSSNAPVVLLSSVAILKPKDPMFSTFLNTLLARKATIENLRENYVSGSAIPRIVLKDFKRYPLVKPSEAIFQAWSSSIESMFKKSVELDTSSKLLSNLRDSLLPKLLSGQITIPDAEQQLAEVL